MCCSSTTGKWLKAQFTYSKCPSVIPSSTPVVLEKVRFWQIMPPWNSCGDIRGIPPLYSEVCGSRSLSLIKSAKTSSVVLMKNFFLGGCYSPREALESISRTFLADEISGVTFKRFLFKRSHVRCRMTDNRTACQSCKWHLRFSGSDCPFRRALCWLKRRGQAINDIRAGVSYFRQSKIDPSDQMF